MSKFSIYSEIFAAISGMGKHYITKLPKQFWDAVLEKCDMQNTPVIDQNKPLGEQGLSKDALGIMAYINLVYWCETDAEKQAYMAKLEKNEQEILADLSSATGVMDLLHRIRKNE